jgi:hypothetical protein
MLGGFYQENSWHGEKCAHTRKRKHHSCGFFCDEEEGVTDERASSVFYLEHRSAHGDVGIGM